jgi:hypothetical protein
MKAYTVNFVVLSSLLVAANASATVLYVDLNSANPVSPYAGWSTAATNIQDAIDASSDGDQIWVTNGIYQTGGKSMDGDLTNRVTIDKAIVVQSVNGPGASIIQGSWNPTVPIGTSAVRCVWMTNGATLSGFTIRGGATRLETTSLNQKYNGGGIWGSASNRVTVFNCIIINNVASYEGGGAYQVTLNNCTLISNQAFGSGSNWGIDGDGAGGGAADSFLRNCAVTQNSAINNGGGVYYSTLINCTVSLNKVGYDMNSFGGYGGGVAYSSLTNSIVFANLTSLKFTASSNFYGGTLIYCCSVPLPAGTGNIGADPQLLGDGVHLAATSPCRGAGTNIVMGTDIDGQPWNNPPPIGCDEWQPAPVIAVQPNFQVGTAPHTLNFNTSAAGQSPFAYWWNKDGTAIQDDYHYSSSGTPNLTVNNFDLPDAGAYQVVVSNSFGMATSQLAQVVIHCVDVTGANATAPYSSWTTAATSIQDAINVASSGEIVLVTNGVYNAGGKIMAGDLTNRVALDKALTVMSENGYAVTVIQGAWDPATTNGPLAVRCAWLTNGATLSGFTLQGGATRSTVGLTGGNGGGVWFADVNTTNPMPNYCRNCLIRGNAAATAGGGSYGGKLYNCLLTGNILPSYSSVGGGGSFWGTLINCTVAGNYAFSFYGGGTSACLLTNSIVYGNSSPLFSLSPNYGPFPPNYSYSCTFPSGTTYGVSNIFVDPQFVDAAYHLSTTSPCRGMGSSVLATGADLDGEPWINPPSMGCYEVYDSDCVGPLSLSIQTTQTSSFVGRTWGFTGLISGRAARLAWSFGDGPTITNVSYFTSHVWTNAGDYNVTFTAYNADNPGGVYTNLLVHVLPLYQTSLQSASFFSSSTSSFQFQFTGQSNAIYIVQMATNLAPPIVWRNLQTNISTGGVVQITDVNATNVTSFYRVSAQ